MRTDVDSGAFWHSSRSIRDCIFKVTEVHVRRNQYEASDFVPTTRCLVRLTEVHQSQLPKRFNRNRCTRAVRQDVNTLRV